MIAAALGCECLENDIGDEEHGDVVIIKQAPESLVREAKARGNRIIYDVLDWLCYAKRAPERILSWYGLVDLVLVPNKLCMEQYRGLFPSAEFALVPHQWDPRIKDLAMQHRFLPGYVGKQFNLGSEVEIPAVTMFADMLEALPRYNCHLSLANHDLLWRWKPATKVASASAVLANVVAAPDPSAKELLPDSYPYWIGSSAKDALEYARQTFNTRTWEIGLEMMAQVRSRTSMDAIASLYRAL